MAEGNAHMLRHSPRYERHLAVIRFTGEVNADIIFALCDEIDFAVDYYQYPKVRIEIDSAGGELKALRYFTSRLNDWRRRGIRIETLALTQCCSAAAYMLSMGDLGHRMAMKRTVLLYHHSRVSCSSQPLTSENMERLKSELSLADAEMIVDLLHHLYGQKLKNEHFAFLQELTCIPSIPGSFVDTNLFALLSNQSALKVLLNAVEAARERDERQTARERLYRPVRDYLRNSFQRIRGIESIYQLQQKLDNSSVSSRDRIAVGWLFHKFEKYMHLFGRDEFITPTDAISAGLIDAIKE